MKIRFCPGKSNENQVGINQVKYVEFEPSISTKLKNTGKEKEEENKDRNTHNLKNNSTNNTTFNLILPLKDNSCNVTCTVQLGVVLVSSSR